MFRKERFIYLASELILLSSKIFNLHVSQEERKKSLTRSWLMVGVWNISIPSRHILTLKWRRLDVITTSRRQNNVQMTSCADLIEQTYLYFCFIRNKMTSRYLRNIFNILPWTFFYISDLCDGVKAEVPYFFKISVESHSSLIGSLFLPERMYFSFS